MEKITLLNTLSGKTFEGDPSVLTHPVFSKNHVAVPEGTKSYSPDKFKPQTAEEYIDAQKARKTDKPKDAEKVPEGATGKADA